MNDVGIGAVGYELDGARTIELELAVHGPFRRFAPSPENIFAGIVIDYSTASGYTHQVALQFGLYSSQRDSEAPEWGKGSPPDRFVNVSPESTMRLALATWTREACDGRVWLSVLIQNSGAEAGIDGRITHLGP